MSNLITLADHHAETAQFYIQRCGNQFSSRTAHYHDHYQICYVTNGTVEHCQGNDAVPLMQGDAYIVSPGFVHKLKFIDPDTQLVMLDFSDTLFHNDFRQSGACRFLQDLQSHHDTGVIPLRLTPEPGQRANIEALFDCLLRQQEESCPRELSAAASMVAAVVYLLAQCYYKNTQSDRRPWNISDNAQLLRRCIVYVDTHYTKPLMTDALAKRFGLSLSALTYAFRQATGLPLHKYIAQKRIQKAKMLIRTQQDMPLSEIGAQVGYEDNSTFYRNFLRLTGISPTKYRELCLESQTTDI